MTRIADTALNVGLNTSLTYDSLNRLTGVNYPGMGKAYTMAFDRNGNRWSQTYTQGSGPQPSVTFNTANQILGMAYDLSGNLTNDGLHSYTYDDDGNLIEVDGGNSSFDSYDALNHRVASLPGGVYTLYGYDADGRRVLTFDGNSGNLVSTNVFWGTRLLATYKGGQVYFQHVDPLGTVRASTDATGSVAGSFQSLPFGDGYTTAGTDTDPQHFAELDKDYGDTHNAQYRQYDSAQARWMSPDPYDGSYDLSNPQSMNRYAYVLNNPLSEADPTGMAGEGAIIGSIGVLGNVLGAVGFVYDVYRLVSLFTGPDLHRPTMRPQGTGTPNYEDPLNESLGYPKGGPQLGGGWGVAGALGIPVDQGCEFGACSFHDPAYPNGNAPSLNPFPYLWEGAVDTLKSFLPSKSHAVCFATGFFSSLTDFGSSSPPSNADVLRTARKGLAAATPRLQTLLKGSKLADEVPILGEFLMVGQGGLAVSDGVHAVHDCKRG